MKPTKVYTKWIPITMVPDLAILNQSVSICEHLKEFIDLEVSKLKSDQSDMNTFFDKKSDIFIKYLSFADPQSEQESIDFVVMANEENIYYGHPLRNTHMTKDKTN